MPRVSTESSSEEAQKRTRVLRAAQSKNGCHTCKYGLCTSPLLPADITDPVVELGGSSVMSQDRLATVARSPNAHAKDILGDQPSQIWAVRPPARKTQNTASLDG
jgi:hypothetical protein